MRWPLAALAALAALAVTTAMACSQKATGPSAGHYTVEFESPGDAVATDFVQIYVFDIVDESKRPTLCQDLISTRITNPGSLKPSVDPPAPPTNICEMQAGVKPISLPYGEHAILAVAQRKDAKDASKLDDLLIGCTIMTIGEGDAPLPIQLRQVNQAQPLPPTNCATVSDYCGGKCQ
jgi:hypothetical protein